MNLKQNILIFSVFKANQTWEQNRNAHVQAMAELKSNLIPCGELVGRYNGASELSIMVIGFQHRDTVKAFCEKFNQESYLESHNDRFTNLVYSSGAIEPIGILTAVSKAEAEKMGSYSYSAPLDQFFVTK